MSPRRPVDAVVTGFTRNAELARHAFAPLLELRQEGHIRSIRYVTWSSSEIDSYVAPVAQMGEVETTRVPMPAAYGNAQQKGVTWQVKNLDAALALVPEDDALVLKLRPDFVMDANFLRTKLATFETFSDIDPDPDAFGVRLPLPPFKRKLWIPWADANQPFFYEDAAFLGLKSDLKLLVPQDLENRLGILDDSACGTFVHVVRWGTVMLERFPIFARYLSEYGAFLNDIQYRRSLIPLLLDDPFFWHLIVANAWILWTGFHIDCGSTGDLLFFANNVNTNADWAKLRKLKTAPPYDDVARWRVATRANIGLLPAVDCLYGRLTDDAWPRAMFMQPHADVPLATRTQIALVLSHYETGALNQVEDAFYEKLARYHRNWVAQAAAQSA